MAEDGDDVAALLQRALMILDERGDHYPALHVCQALEILTQRAQTPPANRDQLTASA